MNDERDIDIVIAVRGLTRSFGTGETTVNALRGVDLDLHRGEFTSIMGRSGSGKSTLMHLIGGLDTPTSGTVCVDGRDLNRIDDDELTLLRRRRIGFVFQAFNLLGVLTAAENVAIPLAIDGMSMADAGERAAVALDLVGLANRRDHRPGELSGGEQQRVAIARALVNDPLIVLADEPTGNLDSQSGDAIARLLRGLVDDHGHTLLVVTHDARHAAIADRLLTLADGRIIEDQRMPGRRPATEVLADLEATP